MSKVGTRMSPGSYCDLPAAQYVRRSWSTPLGARSTGGVLLRTTGLGRKCGVGPLLNPGGGNEITFFIPPAPGQQTLFGEFFCPRRVSPQRPTPADDRARGENP